MDLAQHYRALFRLHGDTPQSAQWSDRATQYRRFEILAEIGDISGKKILDFGCGTGEFASFLAARKVEVQYTGVDIVPEMLEFAQQKYPHFRFGNFEEFKTENFDYIFISGVFNNAIADNRGFYRQQLSECFTLAQEGMAFNMLSTHVDFLSEGLFYEDPAVVLDFAKRKLSPFVTLRHDYRVKPGVIPFEFTVYVYRR